jgi:hypothetical protein
MKNLILIIILLLIIYSSLYFIFKDEIIMQQVKKNNITLDLLISKQPIIVEDKLTNKEIKNLFEYNIIERPISDKIWNRNQYKYLLIKSLNNTNVFISNPKKIKYETPVESDIVIDIQLKKNQSLILPFKWYYSLININDIEMYGIHDYITYGLNFIF